MNREPDQQSTCRDCGARFAAAAGVCPACATASGAEGDAPDKVSEWARARDGLKTKWVAAVIAFWVSAAVLAIVFVVEDRLDLILTSISLAMLLIGMWLKVRYMGHLRREPSRL